MINMGTGCSDKRPMHGSHTPGQGSRREEDLPAMPTADAPDTGQGLHRPLRPRVVIAQPRGALHVPQTHWAISAEDSVPRKKSCSLKLSPQAFLEPPN